MTPRDDVNILCSSHNRHCDKAQEEPMQASDILGGCPLAEALENINHSNSNVLLLQIEHPYYTNNLIKE